MGHSPRPLGCSEANSMTVRRQGVAGAGTKMQRNRKSPIPTLANTWVAYSEGTSEGASSALPKPPRALGRDEPSSLWTS